MRRGDSHPHVQHQESGVRLSATKLTFLNQQTAKNTTQLTERLVLPKAALEHPVIEDDRMRKHGFCVDYPHLFINQIIETEVGEGRSLKKIIFANKKGQVASRESEMQNAFKKDLQLELRTGVEEKAEAIVQNFLPWGDFSPPTCIPFKPLLCLRKLQRLLISMESLNINRKASAFPGKTFSKLNYDLRWYAQLLFPS